MIGIACFGASVVTIFIVSILLLQRRSKHSGAVEEESEAEEEIQRNSFPTDNQDDRGNYYQDWSVKDEAPIVICNSVDHSIDSESVCGSPPRPTSSASPPTTPLRSIYYSPGMAKTTRSRWGRVILSDASTSSSRGNVGFEVELKMAEENTSNRISSDNHSESSSNKRVRWAKWLSKSISSDSSNAPPEDEPHAIQMKYTKKKENGYSNIVFQPGKNDTVII